VPFFRQFDDSRSGFLESTARYAGDASRIAPFQKTAVRSVRYSRVDTEKFPSHPGRLMLLVDHLIES
jgi:hypothetical protein